MNEAVGVVLLAGGAAGPDRRARRWRRVERQFPAPARAAPGDRRMPDSAAACGARTTSRPALSSQRQTQVSRTSSRTWARPPNSSAACTARRQRRSRRLAANPRRAVPCGSAAHDRALVPGGGDATAADSGVAPWPQLPSSKINWTAASETVPRLFLGRELPLAGTRDRIELRLAAGLTGATLP